MSRATYIIDIHIIGYISILLYLYKIVNIIKIITYSSQFKLNILIYNYLNIIIIL